MREETTTPSIFTVTLVTLSRSHPKTQNHATRCEAHCLVFHPPAPHEARHAISR